MAIWPSISVASYAILAWPAISLCHENLMLIIAHFRFVEIKKNLYAPI